jgi:Na+-driven multidrug efflux pump
MAVAVGTSIGVNSVLSRALGRRDGLGARSVKANALFLALAGAAVCLAAGLFSSSPIARCLTRDEQTQSLVTSYLRIYLIGGSFSSSFKVNSGKVSAHRFGATAVYLMI